MIQTFLHLAPRPPHLHQRITRLTHSRRLTDRELQRRLVVGVGLRRGGRGLDGRDLDIGRGGGGGVAGRGVPSGARAEHLRGRRAGSLLVRQLGAARDGDGRACAQGSPHRGGTRDGARGGGRGDEFFFLFFSVFTRKSRGRRVRGSRESEEEKFLLSSEQEILSLIFLFIILTLKEGAN